jgi:hypothetical protein
LLLFIFDNLLALTKQMPNLQRTPNGRFTQMFISVITGCVVSAPLNEVRGYVLQNPERKLPMRDFFQAGRFLRSTSTGAVSMGLSMGISAVVSKPLQNQFVRAINYTRSSLIKEDATKGKVTQK